jgi:hypothetical protein
MGWQTPGRMPQGTEHGTRDTHSSRSTLMPTWIPLVTPACLRVPPQPTQRKPTWLCMLCRPKALRKLRAQGSRWQTRRTSHKRPPSCMLFRPPQSQQGLQLLRSRWTTPPMQRNLPPPSMRVSPPQPRQQLWMTGRPG